MNIGLFIPMHRFADDPPTRTSVDHFREAVEQAVAADRAGFDTVWVPEHQFIKFFAAPAPLQLLVKMATCTRYVRLGTACIVLPFYHPLRAAAEIAAADALTDGRLELGLGRGVWEVEFVPLGQTVQESKARFEEAIDIMLGAWAQEDFAFQGPFTSFDPITLPVQPIQQPHPPIWIAATQDATIEWSVRRGFNVLVTPNRDDFRTVEHKYEVFQGAIEQAEREGLLRTGRRPKIATSRMGVVTDTDEQARRYAPAVLANHRLKGHLMAACCPVVRGFAGSGPLPVEPSLDDICNNLVMGSPETVVERLEQYERLGYDELFFYLAFANNHNEVLATIERLGDVVPRLRENRRRRAAALAGAAG